MLPTTIEQVPKSAKYMPNFIMEEEEQDIIRLANNEPRRKWTRQNHRRVQIWGGLPQPCGMVTERIPSWLRKYMDKIHALNVFRNAGPPNHVLINEYLPGQGIIKHTDGMLYHPFVATISCGSHTILEFERYTEDRCEDLEKFSFLLEPRSLLILSDEMYYDYLHSIAERDSDCVSSQQIRNLSLCSGNYEDGDVLKRATRLSLTFRSVPFTWKARDIR